MTVTVTVDIPSNQLLAIRQFAAGKTERRKYLQGVHVDCSMGSDNIVATDGRAIGVCRLPQPASHPVKAIIPNELIDSIKPKPFETVTATFGPPDEHDDTVRRVTLTVGARSASGLTIAGPFPDYRQVIPRETTGQAAQFNPELFTAIGKAALALAHGRKHALEDVRISYNGQKGALLLIAGMDCFIGVVMPLRVDLGETTAPEWVFEP